MHICIDSSALIPGLLKVDPHSEKLISLIDFDLQLKIPRLIALEVTRNLYTAEQTKNFYRIFNNAPFAQIIDEPIPEHLVELYSQRGLPEKADAFIGAFAEWQEVPYIISDNRHFLKELTESSFEVCTPKEFLTQTNRL